MPVNGEIFGVLRGAPPSKHHVLARVLLGTAIGALAIDAGLDDECVLAQCARAHRSETPLGETAHEVLACKLLHLAAHAIPMLPAEFLALCGVLLQQIRATAGNAEAIGKFHAAIDAAAKPTDD